MIFRRNIAATMLASGSLLLTGSVASAGVIAHADVDGLGTFEDTSTGAVWLKLGNFLDETPDQMLAAANAAGFILANESQVLALTESNPVPDIGSWLAVEAIVGGAPNRQLMWAFSGPLHADGNYNYTYAYNDMLGWRTIDDVATHNVVENGVNPAQADMNIWAIQGAAGGVPEPACWTLMISGLGMAGAALRRRRTVVPV